MAEAAVDTANARFFCHECNREVSPNLPEFTCPQCQGGFIEQLAQGAGGDSAEEDENLVDVENDPAAQFADLWQRAFLRSPPSEDGDRRRNRPRRARTRINIRANQRQGEQGETANAVTAAAIDAILQNLLGGLGSPVSRSEDGAGPSGNLVFPFSRRETKRPPVSVLVEEIIEPRSLDYQAFAPSIQPSRHERRERTLRNPSEGGDVGISSNDEIRCHPESSSCSRPKLAF